MLKLIRLLGEISGRERIFKMIKKIVSLVLAALMFSTTALAREDEVVAEYEYMDKLFGFATELYIDDTITKEEILKRAVEEYLKNNPEAMEEIIKNGFSQLDDYTEYYTEEEFLAYHNNLNHTFYGIGVIIQKEGDYVQITNVLQDGSAYAAGIQAGDLIKKVNGEDMQGLTIDQVQTKVVGELGTEVEITVLRNGQEFTYTMRRAPVNDRTVNHLIFDENTAYISIINFAQNTAQEFNDVLNQLDEKSITNIILDLRNNPGGYLETAVEIAKLTVPKGIIVQTIYRQSEQNQTYYSTLENPKYKFAVLVNQDTASAAEVLTSAMQDSGVAEVIGETTYGKAIIQEMFSLRGYEGFKITTGRYLTRNSKEINKKGIEPDEYVLNTTETIDVSKYPKINYQEETEFGDVSGNVAVIKERLYIMGYHISSVDNNFTADLEAAVLDFQIEKGLEPTGALDRVTMVQIENAFAQTETLVDNQLYTAYEYFGGTREVLDKVIYGGDAE